MAVDGDAAVATSSACIGGNGGGSGAGDDSGTTVAATVTAAYGSFFVAIIICLFLGCSSIVFIQMRANGNFNLQIQFTQLCTTSETHTQKKLDEEKEIWATAIFCAIFSALNSWIALV